MPIVWGCVGRGDARPKVFVIACKRCKRHILAGAETFPTDNIRVDCPLCGEKRRYRPTEVFLGEPSTLLGEQNKMDMERIRVNRRRRGMD
jgi:RNase P subunit RPR2